MESKQSPLLFGIVAGESSGDILGADLMQSLQALHPDVQFIGVGGPLMQEQGLQSLFPMEVLSVMGIADVLKNLPQLLRCKKQVIQTMLENKPDVFIGIDAPDFNLPIEKKLKAKGVKTVHYVSPSVWAWRQKRIFSIKKATDLVLSILPFEPDFYQRFGAKCTFVGHPLAETIPDSWSANEARTELGLAPDQRYVGLLPGSRGGEVSMLIRPFLEAAVKIQKQYPDIRFLIPAANPARRQQIEAQLESFGELNVTLFDGNSREVIAASDAVVLASGTVALEAMLIKRPMVVCYRFGWLNFQIFSRVVRLSHFSLPNILYFGLPDKDKQGRAAEYLVPELLQQEVTGSRIADTIQPYLSYFGTHASGNNNSGNSQSGNQATQQLITSFSKLHDQLRQNAGDKAARAILALL